VKRTRKALKFLEDLFTEEDDHREPGFDPVQLGGAVVITIAAIGGVYWLLWTLLVYEGGIFMKLRALFLLAFTKTKLADLGYEAAPYAMGQLEGWLGNLLALTFTLYVVRTLARLYKHPWSPRGGS
jgi:hypothetical protein